MAFRRQISPTHFPGTLRARKGRARIIRKRLSPAEHNVAMDKSATKISLSEMLDIHQLNITI